MTQRTQFLRTDRAIIYALIRLMKTESFDNITVQNILDETPVTRATFYAHFHDKYEVAERMQDMYVQSFQQIPSQMEEIERRNHPKIIQNALLQYREIVQALLKIHTSRVDLRATTAELHKQQYLSRAEGRYAEAEADIYAQAMTAFQLSYLCENSYAIDDEDYYDKVMVTVFLHILKLDKNEAIRKQIFELLPSCDD